MSGGVPAAVGIAASLLLTGAGMHMLRLRRLDPPGRYGAAVTALCLGASAFLAGPTWEWPGGIAVWIGLAGLAGMLAGFWPRPDGARTKPRDRNRRSDTPTEARTLRPFAPLAALAGVLLGGGAAAALSLAAAAWLPLAPLERGFLAIVLWPVLWSVALLWLYSGKRSGRAALSAGAVALAAGGCVWLAYHAGAQHAP